VAKLLHLLRELISAGPGIFVNVTSALECLKDAKSRSLGDIGPSRDFSQAELLVVLGQDL
jgi:hypothetical protein